MESVGLLLIRTPTSLKKYNLDLMRDDDDDDWRNFNSFHSSFASSLPFTFHDDVIIGLHIIAVSSTQLWNLMNIYYSIGTLSLRRAAAIAVATLDQWKVVFARLKGAKGWERLTVWLMIPGKTQSGLYTQIDTLKEFFKANERTNGGENAKAKAIRTVLEIDSVVVVFWRHEKSDLEIFDVWIEAGWQEREQTSRGKI